MVDTVNLEQLTANQLAGRNIHRLRVARGWNQLDLAARLAELTGKPWRKDKISRCEWPEGHIVKKKGGDYQRMLSPDDLIAFARVFDVTPVELITPREGESVHVGDAVLPADAFMWLVFHQGIPESYFSDLKRELERLVAKGKFAGWATKERLVSAAGGQAFTEWEAQALASDEFFEWETGVDPNEPRTHTLTGRAFTPEELANPGVITPSDHREGEEE